MIGAIVGDVIGSVYEGMAVETIQGDRSADRIADFQPLFHPLARFTDDTVMSIAVAEHLLNGGDLVHLLKEYGGAYPHAGYGGRFKRWLASEDRVPYQSWGNGSAMRVSPVGHAFDSLNEVIAAAERSAVVTHNHPEGVKGARATAAAVFLARTGATKQKIRDYVEDAFEYDLSRPLEEIRATLGFDVTCQGTVPPALRAFLESSDYESAVRLAVSLGGDVDTLACVAGAVAGPFYGVPDSIRAQAMARLDDRIRAVVEAFAVRFPSSAIG